MKAKAIIAALALLLAAGVIARAEDGWSISQTTSGKVTTFTITRSNTSVAETVRYRLVNLSAYAGQHYNVTKVNGQNSNALSGEFTFAEGDNTSRTVQVTEIAASTTTAYAYQTVANRSYKLEVTDIGGFHLADDTREMPTSTNTNVTGSGVFDIKNVVIKSDEYTADDRGYANNGYQSASASSYCIASTQAYLGFLNAELRMTLSLDAKENDDGYQYLQLLINNTSSCDKRDNASNGDPGNSGTPSLSLYMAGFEIKSGSKDDEYKSYSFPITSVGSGAGANNPWGYGTNYPLDQQRFKSGCRATDGRIIIPTDFSALVLRLNASGSSGSDEWAAMNVKAHIQAVDGTAPTISAVSVAPGKHARGNTVYVSVAFNEIVKVTGTLTLNTDNDWGSLGYIAGDGTNVLTFSGTIPADASGNLNVTGLSGTVKDLAGNTLTGSSVIASNLCALDASYAYTITYNLDDGSVATANPTSYTYETATFTLNNPAKTTCYFNGWTGSNGNTPQTSVTIDTHSHGNKSYTAGWTKVWTGSGTQADPYIITSTKGLDLLAQYVNSGNNSSGLCCQLGSDITYSSSHAWNVVAVGVNNYTAIGNEDHPFQGVFDGQDYTVSGIRIFKYNYSNDRTNKGLFGVVGNDGIVKHVNLADARITAGNNVGGIAGNTYANATIEDCTVGANVCIHAMANDDSYHGGIVGFNNGAVSRCISRATLTVSNSASGYKDFGGLVGFNNAGHITDCLAFGTVIPDVIGRGAIVGFNNGGALTRNYYYSCSIAGVENAIGVGKGDENNTETSDVTGALPLYAITMPEHASLVRTGAERPGTGNNIYDSGADFGGLPYATASSALRLSTAQDYVFSSISVNKTYSGEAVDVTDNGDGTYDFTMPAADVTVTATILPIVSYIDADGTEQSQACTPLVSTDSDVNLSTGWYVVSGDVTISGEINFSGDTHIILCDGATLTVNSGDKHGIYLRDGYIYCQNNGTGSIMVNSNRNGIFAEHDLYIYGGKINVTGGWIGIFASFNISILGGNVNALTTSSDATDFGIMANGTITLGCHTAADHIKATSYSGTVTVASGQTLTDGNSAHTYTGTLSSTEIAAIAGKTLMKAMGPVCYIDENGQEQTCSSYTILTGSTELNTNYGANGEDNWYVVNTDISTKQLTFKDNITNIILCDNVTLSISVSSLDGIDVVNGSVNIFSQSGGTGAISIKGSRSGIDAVNNIDINGGMVTVSNAESSGISCSNGNITIRRGNINVSGHSYGICGNQYVRIIGGIINASSSVYSSQFSYGGIVSLNRAISLGCATAADRITASSYVSPQAMSIASGQTLYAGDTPYTGVLYSSQMDAIAGQTLVPYPAGASVLTARKACLAGQERYWTTFYHPGNNYFLPASAQAFIMKNDMILYRVGDGRIIPAGCAVIIMADASAMYGILAGSGYLVLTATSADAPSVSGNILQGTSSAATVPGAYVLSKVSDNFGFYEYTGEIPANKAYYVE